MMLGLCALVLTLTASAQTLTRADGKAVTLPNQFIVSGRGVQFVPRGSAAVVLKWEEINLRALAANEPAIEEARQRVLLNGKSEYFAMRSRWSYLKAFMALPVEVKFQRQIEVRSRTVSTYDVSLNGYITGSDPVVTFQASGFITRTSATTSVLVDRTRYPLATNIEGLLLTIGDDRSIESSRLIRDLQKHSGFFQNLITGLRDLEQIYPGNTIIAQTIVSLDGFAAGANSVDAQRQVRSFANYVRGLR